MRFKDVAQLEDLIFQCIEGLHQAKQLGDKNSYVLALQTLELLNDDYRDVCNTDFISKERLLTYHEGQWSIQWKR